MDCELCGRHATGKAKIEGTVVSVCDSCSKFGQAVHEAKPVKMPDRPKMRAPEEVYFVDNFPAVIRRGREELSLTRQELAGKIKEKVSVIERIEGGSRPEKAVAEKLERVLGIRLMSSVDAEKIVIQKKTLEPLTLGDVVTVRKRKK